MRTSGSSRHVALCAVAAIVACTARAGAEPIVVDRAVVTFVASETGGPATPRYVFERQLAFEARIEAMADGAARGIGPGGEGYTDRHVRAALERHVSETLLASRHIEPEPKPADLSRRTTAARQMLVQRVGGADRLRAAQQAEGIAEREVLRMLRRQARASLYLDLMVEPMLRPSDAELRRVLLTVQTPFRGQSFEDVRPALRRWYVSRRFTAALGGFYQKVRSRLRLAVLTD